MMLNVDFMLRLLVAGILGAIIGLDREETKKLHKIFEWEKMVY